MHLKLADYGISKQISPQGTRGQEGTPQYLPPEVLLHGGQESYSFKVDVYSFGMFLYFLFSFKNPFDKEVLIASLLRDGRRPELPTKVEKQGREGGRGGRKGGREGGREEGTEGGREGGREEGTEGGREGGREEKEGGGE